MRISEQWIKQWVALTGNSDETVSQLTMLGLEVDEVLPAAGEFSGVVVAEISHCESHPDADKLQVCRVNDGQNEWQIVCGAPNARVGIKVPLAQVGAVLPGNFKIKNSKLRGVESAGMLCSEVELGLSEEASGLMELPMDAPLGQSLSDYLSLDDVIIDIDLTPNRADCFSVRGVARDLAVVNQIEFNELSIQPLKADIDTKVEIDLQAPQACGKYCGRIITGVNNQISSPIWLQEALRKSGLRSIHPVVDVTNYVMLELGQPMHAFAKDAVKERIVVRMAKKDETITLLDGSEAQLDPSFLVIADAQKPLAVAGVMGGADSGVHAETTDIILESAYFNPADIMGKSRRLGVHTDSALRFERGVDWQLQEQAMERASQLIVEICGGQVGPINTVMQDSQLPKRQTIQLTSSHLRRVLGFNVADAQVSDIFQRLGFEVDHLDSGWQVKTPSWRFDLSIPEDLIEEVVRVVGYDQMPADYLHSEDAITIIPEQLMAPIQVKKQLVAFGFQEVINYAFVSTKQLENCRVTDGAYALANPLTQEMAVMRTHLLPGLLANIKQNIAHGDADLALFELGKVFSKSDAIAQQDMLLLAQTGLTVPEQWSVAARKTDFYDLKGHVSSILSSVPGERKFVPSSVDYLHPGRQAQVTIDDKVVGYMGQVHPAICAKLKIKAEVFVAQLNWNAIEQRVLPQWQAVSKYPGSRRDLSLVLPENIQWQQMAEGIKGLMKTEGDLLRQLLLFDVYTGEPIEKGYKSFAIALIFQAKNRTLEDKEVDKLVAKGVSFLEHEFNAEIRA